MLVAPGHDVLEVGDAHHVVLVLARHRDAREPAAQVQRQGLVERLVPLDEHHLRAGDHHLADDRVPQLEDRADHLALAGLDDAALLEEVDQAAQLGLAGQRAHRGALAAGEHAARADEDPRYRAEQDTERVEHGGRAERDPLRAAAAERDGADAHHQVADDDHDRQRDQVALPRGAEPVHERGHHQDGRGGLTEHAEQQQDVEVARQVGEDGLEPARGGTGRSGQLLRTDGGQTGQRRLRARPPARHEDEHDRGRYQPALGGHNPEPSCPLSSPGPSAGAASAALPAAGAASAGAALRGGIRGGGVCGGGGIRGGGGRSIRGGIRRRGGAAGPPRAQQPVLQAEHLGALVGLRVVVAEQVQDAVHGEQFQLVLGAVAGVAGLNRRDLRAQHHVPEQAGIGAGFLRARPAGVDPAEVRRPQLVHREREDVGRARLAHPALVQLGHGLLVHHQHGELGQGMDAHLVQHVAGDRGQCDLVDLHAGLVGDINTHPVRAVSDRASPLRVPRHAGLRPAARSPRGRTAPRRHAAGRRTARRRRRCRRRAGAGRHRGWSNG